MLQIIMLLIGILGIPVFLIWFGLKRRKEYLSDKNSYRSDNLTGYGWYWYEYFERLNNFELRNSEAKEKFNKNIVY